MYEDMQPQMPTGFDLSGAIDFFMKVGAVVIFLLILLGCLAK